MEQTSYDPKKDTKMMQDRLAQARESIAGSLAELAGEMQEVTDVRAWVRREPWLLVGGAAIVGFLLSQKPKAISAMLSRLLPMAAMAAAKPMLEKVGRDLGATVVSRVHA